MESFHCPHCKTALPYSVDIAGCTVTCGHCAKASVAPPLPPPDGPAKPPEYMEALVAIFDELRTARHALVEVRARLTVLVIVASVLFAIVALVVLILAVGPPAHSLG